MYIVGRPSGSKKPLLLKAIEGKSGMFSITDKSRWDNPITYKLSSNEILAHLGDKPEIGKVFGIDTEAALKRKIYKGWGEVFLYKTVSDHLEQRLIKAFVYVLGRLKKMNKTSWHPLSTEIRNPKGIKLGHYHYKSNDTDTLALFLPESISYRELVRIIAHEAAHGVWFRDLNNAGRARWINTHLKYASITSVDVTTIKRLVSDLYKAGSISEYSKDTSIEELATLNMYVKWATTLLHVDKRDLNVLIEDRSGLPIPSSAIFKSKIESITEYAAKNPRELFAESYASLFIDDLKNDKIKKLIKST